MDSRAQAHSNDDLQPPAPRFSHHTGPQRGFALGLPMADLGPIPEQEDAAGTAAGLEVPVFSPVHPHPAVPGRRPSTEGSSLHSDALPSYSLRQRRSAQEGDDQPVVDPLPRLPSLSIRTRVASYSEDESAPGAQESDGLLGYISKGLGGFFASSKPPKPSVPGTARSNRSTYSSRSAFQRSVYQEQVNQQLETSVNNFSKFLKDRGHNFKGKMAASMSEVGSNYDALSAAPDSPFSAVMSTISEWNLPEHTEFASEHYNRSNTRLDLSRIDRRVDTKIHLDRYLASQPAAYPQPPGSSRELEHPHELPSPAPPSARAQNTYFSESPSTRQGVHPAPFESSTKSTDHINSTNVGSSGHAPLTSSFNHTESEVNKSVASPGQSAEKVQPCATSLTSPEKDLKLASHPLAMFAALGAPNDPSTVEDEDDGAASQARMKASPNEEGGLGTTQNNQETGAVSQTKGESSGATATDQIHTKSNVEQQLWHTLLAHNQAVIDKQDAEARNEALAKQVKDLKQQLTTTRQQLDSSRQQHSTAAQQAEQLGGGMSDLQAESAGLSALVRDLQRQASAVAEHKREGLSAVRTKMQQLLALLKAQEAALDDRQSLINSGKAREEQLRQLLAERERSLASTHEQLSDREATLASTQSQLSQTEKTLTFTRAQLSEREATLDTTQSQLIETERILTSTQEQLAEREATLASTQSELTETQETVTSTQEQLRDRETTLASTQSQLTETEARLASTQEQLTNREATLASTQSQLTDTAASLASAEEQLTDQGFQLAFSRGLLDETEHTLSSTREQLAEREATLASTQGQLTEREATLAATQQQLSETEHALSSTQAKLTETEASLASTQNELAETAATLASVKDQLAEREAALASTQGELVEREATLSSTQNQLAEAKAGIASLEVTLKSRESELDATAAKLKTTESARQTTDAKLHTTESTLQVTEAKLQTTESTLQTTEAKLQTTESTLKSTEAKLQTTESTLQTTEAKLSTTETQLQTRTATLQCTEVKLSTSQSQLLTTQAGAAALRAELEQLRSQTSVLESALKEVLSELGTLGWYTVNDGLASLGKDQTEAKDCCAELVLRCAELEEDTLSAATTFMEMQEDLHESDDALREVRAERQSLASRCEILKQSNTRLLAESEETADEVRELRQERQMLSSRGEILRQENVALGAKMAKLEEEKERAEEAEAKLAQRVPKLEKQLVVSQEAVQKLQEGKRQLEEMKEKLEQQVQQLQDQSTQQASALLASRSECESLRQHLDTLQSQLSLAHNNMEQLSTKTGALRGAVASISAEAACLLELRQQLSQQLEQGHALTAQLSLTGHHLTQQISQRFTTRHTPYQPSPTSRALSAPAPSPSSLPSSSPASLPPPLPTSLPTWLPTAVPTSSTDVAHQISAFTSHALAHPMQPGTPPRGPSAASLRSGPDDAFLLPGTTTTGTPTGHPSPGDSWVPGTPPQVSSESMAQAMMQQAELIEMLESEVVSLQEQVLAAQEQVTDLCSRMGVLQGDNGSLRELNGALQEKLSAAGAQMAVMQDALGQVAEVERELRGVQEGLMGVASHAQQAVSAWPELGEVRMKVVEVETAWQSQLEAAEQLRQRMLAKLTSEQMNVSELTQQLASAESQQRQLAVQLAAAGHLRKELEQEVERVRKTSADLSRDLRSAKNSNMLLESRVEEAVGELRSVRVQLDQAKGERDRSVANSNRLLSKHEDLQRHTNNLRNRCSELACEVESARRSSRQVQNAVRELQNLKAELHQTEMLCTFLSRCTQTFSANREALISDLQPIQAAWVALLYSPDSPLLKAASSGGKGNGTVDDSGDPTFLPLPPSRLPNQSQLNLALKGGRELVKILNHIHCEAKTSPVVARALKRALSRLRSSLTPVQATPPPSPSDPTNVVCNLTKSFSDLSKRSPCDLDTRKESPRNCDVKKSPRDVILRSPGGLVRNFSTPMASPCKENGASSLSSADLSVFLKVHLDFDPAQVLKDIELNSNAEARDDAKLAELTADVAAAKHLLTSRLQQLLQPLSQHAREWGGSWDEFTRMLAGEKGGDHFGESTGAKAGPRLQLEQLVAIALKVLVFLCKLAAQQQRHQQLV